MNKNSIEFKTFQIDIPKITDEQYLLLRFLLMSIEKSKAASSQLYIDICLFPDHIDLKSLLKKNIEISVTDHKNNTWNNFYIMNDIVLSNDKVFFTPAKIITEIIKETQDDKSKMFLKYVLFNGIKQKQALLLIDYLLKSNQKKFNLSLLDLKKIFEFTENQYKNWHQFKKFLDEKVLKEINEKTSIKLKYKVAKKEGKKVVALSFNYKKG